MESDIFLHIREILSFEVCFVDCISMHYVIIIIRQQPNRDDQEMQRFVHILQLLHNYANNYIVLRYIFKILKRSIS